MWNKLSLHAKITFITTMILVSVCFILTLLSYYNLQNSVIIPMVTTVTVSKIDNPYALPGTGDDNQIKYGAASAMGYFGEIRNLQYNYIIYAAVIMLVLVIIGVLLAFYFSGRALKPLKLFAGQIAGLDENGLKTKLPEQGGSLEVTRLTHSFNSMLDKLNLAFEARKRFAQNAAHELKTPLAGIMANIEVLELDEEPSLEEYREVVALTKENTQRLIMLVQNLLMLNQTLDRQSLTTLNGRELFGHILKELEKEIADKDINVILEGDILIRGDSFLLERAFFNLVQNAVRYNKEHGHIVITLQDRRITIEDSGIGIPEECLPYIFETFYCADKSRSRMQGGSGLGLSVTKQILDLHAMQISVESELLQYTRIIINLTGC